MITTKDEVVEKIRKLLALGERGGTKEEAELAMMKAQEVALRHQIDFSSINVNPPEETYDKVVFGEDVKVGRKSICQKFISSLIVTYFNVRVISSGNRYDGKKMTFIGKTSDIKIAEYIQGFLSREMMELWKDYKRKTNSPTSHRNSFIYGLYTGISEKLKSSKANIIHEYDTQVQNNYWLVVQKDSEKLGIEVAKVFPKLKTERNSVGYIRSQDAVSAGHAAGLNINLNPTLN